MDPHQRAKIQTTSTSRYARAAVPFAGWLLHHRLDPQTAKEWDRLLVEFKQVSPKLSLSDLEAIHAAIEHLLPQYKGRLPWTKAVLCGWRVVYKARHTVPMLMAPCCWIASHMSARGKPRLGVGVILQAFRGLRPNSMLSIQSEDLIVSASPLVPEVQHYIVINLGVRTGTKAKRPQSAVIRKTEAPWLFHTLMLLKAYTPPVDCLFPFSLSQYRSELAEIQEEQGLEIGWTPHSPRAGFASESIALGVPFPVVKDIGHWVSDSSLKVYIDVVQAVQIQAELKSKGFSHTFAFTLANIDKWFPAEWLKNVKSAPAETASTTTPVAGSSARIFIGQSSAGC